MKYLPTLDLWDPGVGVAVQTGRLKLQRGQWVRCGQNRRSRIVKISPAGIIWASHPQTDKGRDSRQHRHWLDCIRSQRETA